MKETAIERSALPGMASSQQQNGASSLEALPDDILVAILSKTNAAQLAQARLACRRLAAIGKRSDLPPRQEQLQSALSALGDSTLLARGFRQASRPPLGRFLTQRGATETLCQMAALELSINLDDKSAMTGSQLLGLLAPHLAGSHALQTLRLRNFQLPLLDTDVLRDCSGLLLRLHTLEVTEERPLSGGLPNIGAGAWQDSDPWCLYGHLPAEGLQSLSPLGQGFRCLSFYSSVRPEEGQACNSPTPPLTVGHLASLRSLRLALEDGDSYTLLLWCSCFTGVTSLYVTGEQLGNRGIAFPLAHAPVMANLTSLSIAGRDVSLADLVLYLSPHVWALRSLSLLDVDFRSAYLPRGREWATYKPIKGLTALHLSGSEFTPSAALAISSLLDFGVLRTLGLADCCRGGGMPAGEWPRCVKRWAALAPRLTSLDLGGGGLAAGDVEGLVTGPAALRELSEINLRGNPLGPAVVAPLSGLSWLASLDLSACGIGDGGAAMLALAPGFSSLRRLVLDGNGISGSGLACLAASSSLSGLHDLSLARNLLTGGDAHVLGVSASLAGLTRLCLSGNAIRDEGAEALAWSHTLRELACLDVEECQVSTAGADHLAFSTSLVGLQQVRWSRWEPPPGACDAGLGVGVLQGVCRGRVMCNVPLPL